MVKLTFFCKPLADAFPSRIRVMNAKNAISQRIEISAPAFTRIATSERPNPIVIPGLITSSGLGRENASSIPRAKIVPVDQPNTPHAANMYADSIISGSLKTIVKIVTIIANKMSENHVLQTEWTRHPTPAVSMVTVAKIPTSSIFSE